MLQEDSKTNTNLQTLPTPFKNVLVLGSGLVSEPLVDYLWKKEKNIITIGSNNLKEAQNLVENLIIHNKGNNMADSKEHKDRLKVVEIDIVKEKTKLYNLVKSTDI